MRHFFVINSHSFRKRGDLQQLLLDIENSFSVQRRMDYKIYLSRYPRDAISSVHRYIVGCGGEPVRVYAIGGDGILFDCLNGMFGFQNAQLAAVPYGSSNDFIRAFGAESAVKPLFRDINALIAAPAKRVDVIRCGTNYALNNVSVGLEARALTRSYAIARRLKAPFTNHLLPLAFRACAALDALNGKRLRLRYNASVDGADVSGVYSNISISNGPGAGGKFVINPAARPNDGVLNALFVHECRGLRLIPVMGAYIKGGYDKPALRGMLKSYACREIKLTSDTAFCAALDGEAVFTTGVSIRLLPEAIDFVTPEGAEFHDYSAGGGAQR